LLRRTNGKPWTYMNQHRGVIDSTFPRAFKCAEEMSACRERETAFEISREKHNVDILRDPRSPSTAEARLNTKTLLHTA
jgi:hypothetical protein